MILRKLHWILLSKLLYSVIIVESQNERSYDTNDWIPITPSPDDSGEAASQQGVGRVLNLDTPSQKFFPEEEYSHRKRRPQQNDRHKQRNVDKYRLQEPAIYEQPPPVNQGGFLERPISTRQQAPAVDAPNIYDQYNLPFNSSFYQSLNPSSINEELQRELHDSNFAPASVATTLIQDEKQSVQLLYVPLETLKHGQPSTQVTQDSEKIFHQVDAPRQDNQIYNQNNQHLIDDIEHDLIQQTVQAHRLQQQIHLGRPVVLQPTTTTTTTTPKPTKRKPHQPPLAVYLEGHNGANVDDVLSALRDAKTIAVQDAVLPNSPQVFVGPSTLSLPPGYNRFPLPYINKLESNRIERKIENLPFFVAPLSYKTPSGYTKIPLPSPHVGSVVISNKEDSHKRSAPRPTPIYPNQINDYESAKPQSAVDVNANSQLFDPSQQTYYSTTPFLNPTSDLQKPYFLQFDVNDNGNQFANPSKQPQEQLQQPQLSINSLPSRTQQPQSNINSIPSRTQQPQSNINSIPSRTQQPQSNINSIPSRTQQPQSNINSIPSRTQQPQSNINSIPSRTQTQIPDTPVTSFKNLEPVSYNQQANIANPSPQTTLQQSVPGRNSNPYNSPQRTPVEDQNKYNFNQNQNTNNYQIPPRTSPVANTNHESINSYQIPVQGPTGIAQYNQPIKKEEYSIPQTYPGENSNSYQIPSRNIQNTPTPIHSTGSPSRTTASHYDEPPPPFLSSPFGNAQEISITPKTTTTTTTTTTTSRTVPEVSSQYSFDNTDKKHRPLNLAIDKYELHQINSQLEDVHTEKDPYDFDSHFNYDNDKPSLIKTFDYSSQFGGEKSNVKGKYDYSSIFDLDHKPKYDYSSEFERYSSTPSSILRDTFEDIPTTPRVSPKSRRRGKPTRQPARTTTTANPVEKESYTVLEEFSAKPVATPHSPDVSKEVKYESEYKIPTQVEVADVPANVYRIRTTTPNVKVDPTINQYDNVKSVIEDIPAKAYNLNSNQNTPVYTSQQVQVQDKQNLQSNFGKDEGVSHPPTYVQSPLTEVSYVPQYNENPIIEPLVQNRGQNVYNFENKQPGVPEYTSNLRDQTLPVPNLSIPTTEHFQSPPNHQPVVEHFTTTTTTTTTSTTTTMEQPKTTQTTRGRGRQRGGSRFATASATTVASAPRRNVNRRRPVHSSRTTTESPSTSSSSREDIQKVNTRQRFRTRTRPSQSVATERISSTENEVRSYKEPTSETPVEIQTGPQSYMKFEHTVEDQKLIIQSEDTPATDYPRYYNPQLPVTVTESPRHVLQYDNTATTQNPIMDVQITHPAPVKMKKHPVVVNKPTEDAQIHLQAGGVLHNNYGNHKNVNEDNPPRQTNRVRGRGRTRPRVATTTEKPVARTTARPVIRLAPKRTTTVGTSTTTTQRSTAKSIAEDEFFGFIRQPNFNQIYNIQVPAATQQPIQIYDPNQPSNTDVRVNSYQVFGNANKNPNVRVQSYQIPQNSQSVDDVRLDFNSAPSDATTVHFVGEIRPKYRPTTQNYEDIITATETTEPIRIETETPKPRVRGRVRTAPQRKSNVRPSENEVSTYRTQQATRRSNVIRSRGRGTAQYRSPETQRLKEDREADVEGGNYPSSFFQNKQAVVAPVPTSPPSFQISIDPGNEDEDDQLPNPSLYQPKILPRPDQWTEATGSTENNEEYAPANQIDDDIHLEKETVSPDESGDTDQDVTSKKQPGDGNATTDRPIALPVTASDEQTTQNSDEAYIEDTKAMEELFEEVNKTEKPKKVKGGKRGTWKLVRQRPVDPYEVAESQSYYSVVNTFGDIVKIKHKFNSYDDQKSDESLGQHELYNNYNPVLEQNSDTYEYESHKLPSTQPPELKTTKYYEVHDLNAETESTAVEASSTIQPETSSNSTEVDANTTTTEGSIFDTIYEMFGISNKSEDVKELPTTTISSTEPETVPPVTTTVASPTFPEEITEVPTTQTPLEPVKNATDAVEDVTERVETTSPSTQITRTFEVEPWEMKAVRTSTSTEVSHETEICYKGRCVKSADRGL